MEHAIFARMKLLSVALAALALGACTDAGRREAELQDSALLQAPGEPAPAAQPAQAESVTSAPSRTPPQTIRPAQPPVAEPVRQPPPPRDTRPSIPYPPDTL